MKINLYNSLTKSIEEFKPINPNEIKIYSCGPTVYSYAHIGNMRSFLFADLLQRILKTIGNFNVKWVMNITNIDDKTIQNSKKENGNPLQNLLDFTKFYEKEFIVDIEKLKINKNDFYAMPKATDFIVEMKNLIKLLMQNSFAYISGDSIYFNVAEYRKKNKYGKLYKIDFENFKAGLRIDSDQYEREQVSDFVLWKGKKENEPFWDFEIEGKNLQGRPGWHLECSAMEKKLLGLPFDIHTGGVDLKFPHHEDEIAQSKAGYGIEPTNYWCHNEFLEVEGKKMSKSFGNFYTLRELENKGIEPIDVRFAMFSVHYRTKFNFTFQGIESTRKARLRIQDYINNLIKLFNFNINDFFSKNQEIITDKIKTFQENIFSELANDLHTPKALAHIFTFINNNNINELSKEENIDLIKLFNKINNIFKVWTFEIEENEKDNIGEIPENIVELANLRFQAKKEKKFEEADKLRNEISALGYKIIDKKDGFEIKKTNN